MNTGVPYNHNVLGSCSICGGPVVVPTAYWSVIAPIPECASCGAIKADTHGPVVPMVPCPRIVTETSTRIDWNTL
jgi:hypothetical protein